MERVTERKGQKESERVCRGHSNGCARSCSIISSCVPRSAHKQFYLKLLELTAQYGLTVR